MSRNPCRYFNGLLPIEHLQQAKVNALRELQSEIQEELGALLPSHRDATQSVLDRAVEREL
jgi:hypothetical protein